MGGFTIHRQQVNQLVPIALPRPSKQQAFLRKDNKRLNASETNKSPPPPHIYINPAPFLSNHQLNDGRVRRAVPGEGGEPQAGLGRQLAIVPLAAPLAAEVHEEEVYRAHHLRGGIGDDLL